MGKFPRSRYNSVRSQSTSEASDDTNKETERNLKSIPNYVSKQHCHKSRTSLFTSSSGFDDYRGFLNLGLVLLIISNARTFLENLLNYGILVNPLQWVETVIENPHSWPNLILCIMSNFFIITCFHIQRFVAKNSISARVGAILQAINLIVMICVPPFQILKLEANPLGSLCSCGIYVILFLKLWSYSQTNYWHHQDYQTVIKRRRQINRTKSMPAGALKAIQEETEETKLVMSYPYNLSYRNLYYFIFAPTLCYEINFPRNKSVDKTFLTRRVLEMVFLIQVELALTQQWIIPVLKRAIPAMQEQNYSRVVERLLRLSIPNHLVWLIFFYLFFHSFLNVIAEITKFGDREFYRDWWNSQTIEYFWKAWNIPVHKWCVRHVYKPLVKRKWSKLTAQLVVFALSAFFHEYLVTVPLQRIKFWAFLGMIMQVPLTYVTEKIAKNYSPMLGNMLVWVSLIIGQPCAILLYVFDYYASSATMTS